MIWAHLEVVKASVSDIRAAESRVKTNGTEILASAPRKSVELLSLQIELKT